MADQNVRFPPDSTGKRVGHTAYIEIPYDGGTVAFLAGDIVTTQTTLITGTVIKVAGNVAAGTLFLLLNAESPQAVNDNELLQVGSVTRALVNGTGTPIYNQNVVTTGANNPKYGQFVDVQGAAFVRFSEGSPQFDAFGKMQVSQQHKLAEYIFQYDILANDFTTVTATGGVLTHLPNVSGVLLSCSTASGAKVQRTTDEYHVYQAGISHLMEFTTAFGDAGKTNVRRRIGLFDDNNGVYFELNGTTFSVGLRSKSTGAVVEEVISKSAWNGDRLDGSGNSFNLSGVTLDLTKDNIYWLDYQWLGAGSIRFGIVINGVRVVCHEINNANTRNASYMTTGSLPLRYEQENTGVTASTSEMRVFCATVKTEGTFNPFRRAFCTDSSASVTTTTATPILTIRSAQLLAGIDNRVTLYPNSVTIYNSSAQAVLFEQIRGSTATLGAWAAHGGESSAEINKTMTGFTGGQSRFSDIIPPGESRIVELKTFSSNRRGLRRKADIALWTELSYTAKLLAAGAGGLVYAVLNWDEVR